MGWLDRVLSMPRVVEQVEVPPPGVETVEVSAMEPSETVGAGTSLLASATHITKRTIDRKVAQGVGSLGQVAEWQAEAWDMLDHVGEQRFLANTLAGRMSQAALYVGVVSDEDGPGTPPLPAEDSRLQPLLDSLGDGVAGQTQLVYRAGVNLFVAGEVWLIGIPRPLFESATLQTDEGGDETVSRLDAAVLRAVDREAGPDDYDIGDMIWRMFSVSEIGLTPEGNVSLRVAEGEELVASADDLWLIRIWRPHPRKAWEADSPTRASLPVLRELVGLTMHISAQLDSRLAGAGMLLFSQDASSELKRQTGVPENSADDPLVSALTDAMITPIQDRASASAVVPLVVSVPDPKGAAEYMSFSTPLDDEARELRDEAIRRLALGQDAPPEILLGTGGMNHWGAWLVREDTVTTHLEPPLALLCDALTTQFLRPLMRAMGGFSDDELQRTVVWFDVDHMVSRPNRTQDAKDLYAAGVISAEALREATGFEKSDAEDSDVSGESLRERAVSQAVDMLSRAPSLAADPGLPVLVEQLEVVLGGGSLEDAPAAPARGEEIVVDHESGGGVIPDTDGVEARVPGFDE